MVAGGGGGGPPPSGGNSIYLILHNVGSTTPKWCLSWIDEADLRDTDIRIAVIKERVGYGLKDWLLLQLWKSDISGIGFNSGGKYWDIVTKKDNNGLSFTIINHPVIYDANMTGYMYGGNFSHSNFVKERLDYTYIATTIVPTLNAVPVTNLVDNEFVTITGTTYVYLRFNRFGAVKQNVGTHYTGCGPEYQYCKDYITSAIFEVYSSPQTEGLISPQSNGTDFPSTFFRIPIGVITVSNGEVISVTNASGTLANYGWQFSVSYGGSYYPDSWSLQGDPATCVFTAGPPISHFSANQNWIVPRQP